MSNIYIVFKISCDTIFFQYRPHVHSNIQTIKEIRNTKYYPKRCHKNTIFSMEAKGTVKNEIKKSCEYYLEILVCSNSKCCLAHFEET